MLISRKNSALTIALAVVAMAAVPAAANIATSIGGFQYDQNTLAFDGTVTSHNKQCVAGRTVKISSVDSGGTATTIGTTKTDKTGFFSLSDPGAQAGTYEATVAPTKPKKHQPHAKNCAGATTGPQQYLG